MTAAGREMVDDETLVELLNRATLLLYTPRLEPFGYAPLEAGACGLPVVTVPEGGTRETVVDGFNGLWATPEEAGIAQSVLRLLENPTLARELGENGSKWVREKWTLEGACDRLEAFFEKSFQ